MCIPIIANKGKMDLYFGINHSNSAYIHTYTHQSGNKQNQYYNNTACINSVRNEKKKWSDVGGCERNGIAYESFVIYEEI